jgi:hypothetical protein
MRKLMALAAAAGIAIAAAAMFVAVPAASASSSYCFENKLTGDYVGSTTSGNLIPWNDICRVTFTRINYHDISGEGYYEYEANSGPGEGLCIKADPGINDSGYHPVVDYACDNSGDATMDEELWTDPPNVQTYGDPGWYMVQSDVAGEGLYTSNEIESNMALVAS